MARTFEINIEEQAFIAFLFNTAIHLTLEPDFEGLKGDIVKLVEVSTVLELKTGRELERMIYAVNNKGSYKNLNDTKELTILPVKFAEAAIKMNFGFISIKDFHRIAFLTKANSLLKTLPKNLLTPPVN
jgi:hypothetical protein